MKSDKFHVANFEILHLFLYLILSTAKTRKNFKISIAHIHYSQNYYSLLNSLYIISDIFINLKHSISS